MYAMRTDEPELPMIMQRCRYPELAERAMTIVRPVISEAETSRFCHDAASIPSSLDTVGFAAAVASATGAAVNEIIVLPDDGGLPMVQKMARAGQLSPKQRLSDLLHGMHGVALRSLAPDLKDGLRRRLGRIFRLDDEKTAMSGNLDFAVRLARRDAIYHFLAVVVVGDERRAKLLADLIPWMRLVVPLAVVDPRRGLWLAHRVS